MSETTNETTLATAIPHGDVMSLLYRQSACHPAIRWVEGQPRDGASLWAACPRGDWMLWIAARVGVDRKAVVRAACACARLALPYVKAGDERPLKAIETAEAWTRGEATIRQVRDAAAADAYAAYADAYAAYAAAYAADAADAAAYAAYAADAADARDRVRAECADLVRRLIPFELVADAMQD